MQWPDGVEYTGMFRDDMFNGQGQYRWADGKVYIGGWLEGKQHGEGKIIHLNKIKLGVWDNGTRVGEWLKEMEETVSEMSNFTQSYSFISGFSKQMPSQQRTLGRIVTEQFHTAHSASDFKSYLTSQNFQTANNQSDC